MKFVRNQEALVLLLFCIHPSFFGIIFSKVSPKFRVYVCIAPQFEELVSSLLYDVVHLCFD